VVSALKRCEARKSTFRLPSALHAPSAKSFLNQIGIGSAQMSLGEFRVPGRQKLCQLVIGRRSTVRARPPWKTRGAAASGVPLRSHRWRMLFRAVTPENAFGHFLGFLAPRISDRPPPGVHSLLARLGVRVEPDVRASKGRLASLNRGTRALDVIGIDMADGEESRVPISWSRGSTPCSPLSVRDRSGHDANPRPRPSSASAHRLRRRMHGELEDRHGASSAADGG